MRLVSLLLKLAILAPLIYLGVLIAGIVSWPSYDVMTRYSIELGTAAAPQATLYNYGLVLAGGATILGGVGAFLGMLRLGAGGLWAFLSLVGLAVWGAGMIMSGLHWTPPFIPDVSQLGLAVIGAALFMFLALAGRSDMNGVKLLLVLVVLSTAALTAVFLDVGDLKLVTKANGGLWDRAWIVAAFPWFSLAAIGIDRRLAAKARKARSERGALFGTA